MRKASGLYLVLIAIGLINIKICNAQWQQMNGPTGGSINCMTSYASHIFAGTSGAGIFRSGNSGSSWNSCNIGITSMDVYSMTADANRVFAGTHGFIEYGLDALFRTTDGGENWEALSNGLSGQIVFSLLINGSDVYAGIYPSGVFRSTDNGTSWTSANNGITGEFVYALAAVGNELFAATEYGVYRSINNGSGWTTANNGLSSHVVFTFTPKGNDLYAGTYDGGVYRTTNSGASWVPVNNGITNNYVKALTVQGPDLYAGTQGGGVFRSTDNGENWFLVNNGLTTLNIGYLESDGNYLYAGTDQGVFRSNDQGANWTPVNSGIMNRTIKAFIESGPNIFAGLDGGGMYRSSDNGLTWSEVNNGIPNSATITSFTAIGNYLFAGSTGTGIYRSDDQGETWSNIGTYNLYNIAALAVIGQDIYAATINSGIFRSSDFGVTWQEKNWGLGPEDQRMRALHAMGNTLFAGNLYLGVFRSTDFGEHWYACNNGLTGTSVRSFTSNDSAIFAGTLAGNTYYPGGVFRSADNGDTWTITGLTYHHVLSLKAIEDNIIAGTADDGLWLSTDNGENWADINEGFTIVPSINSILISDENLFAGTNSFSVWRRPLSEIIPVELVSFNAVPAGNIINLTWRTATETNNSGFEIERSTDKVSFSKIAFVSGFGTTTEPKNYSYTDNSLSNGIFYYRLRQIDYSGAFAYSDVVEVNLNAPVEFSLFQNFPNPFNPSTKIKFSIPSVETHRDASLQFVVLKVYDVIGNEVATLVNEEKLAGTYEVEFSVGQDSSPDIASGIYFYKLQAGNFSETRKMILMK